MRFALFDALRALIQLIIRGDVSEDGSRYAA